MCIDASELIPVCVEIPVPRLETAFAAVQSMVVGLLVHHSLMAIRAGLSGKELRDKHHPTLRCTMVADHVDGSRRAALDPWTPRSITNKQDLVSSDQLER